MSIMNLSLIETLKKVDLIAAEDTRITKHLLKHFDISAKCISLQKWNEKKPKRNIPLNTKPPSTILTF